MHEAGIDTSVHKAHSLRSASNPFEANVSHGVDADPFLESLSLVQKDSTRPLNSKGFRVFCACDPQLPSGSSRLRPRCWTRFWDISLPHSGRNVWFHLLYDKLPRCSLLHRLIPSAWPELCPLCHHPSESMDHFLFLCPEKLTAWTSIWHTYFGEHTFNVDHVRSALHQLQFPRIDSLLLTLDPEVIFGLALLGIWRSRWLFSMAFLL
ncbi:hypothetical protein G6F70_008902 [Rhizopus microsporus]|nr:hypothetical protein G6F71_008856 [Rhizopus microsporus]KAG1194199.1 hypothetical protein G6F70_008902 [Rhizopus microsporus]KAG1207985.1 hypothetical protein G6F69_007601 [Rhizopus microsporus]KAG1226739.1 hypothetical protein G6F67_008837 [Rhizopus microsporus]KAG1258420.1 hypothetical protein G6F68_008777 [Rhizopus microsporus]